MDLFYRLNVIPLRVPPLRERPEDVPALARWFLEEIAARGGRRPREIDDEALRVLSGLPFPGNELKLGVLTALVGGPFFLWLIVAYRRRRP